MRAPHLGIVLLFYISLASDIRSFASAATPTSATEIYSFENVTKLNALHGTAEGVPDILQRVVDVVQVVVDASLDDGTSTTACAGFLCCQFRSELRKRGPRRREWCAENPRGCHFPAPPATQTGFDPTFQNCCNLCSL